MLLKAVLHFGLALFVELVEQRGIGAKPHKLIHEIYLGLLRGLLVLPEALRSLVNEFDAFLDEPLPLLESAFSILPGLGP